MFFAARLDGANQLGIADEFSSFRGDAPASNSGVQLHIRESISPPTQVDEWIPGSRQ
jgi:hypothetical protein